MLTAVVIAFIAVAVAIGLAVWGLLQIEELRRGLEALTEKLEADVKAGATLAADTAGKRVDWALTQLDISQKRYEEAVGSQRQHSGLLYLSADADVTKAGDMASELADYTVRDLDHQVKTESTPLVARGGLYSGQPAVLDVMPRLIEKFIAAISAELLYSQDDGLHGRKFYFRFPGGPANLAALVGSLLSPSAGGGTPLPGGPELGALLDALRDGYPAVLHLGPLVVMNTQAGAAAGVAPTSSTELTDDQQETAVTGVGANLLTQLAATSIVDLSQ